MNKPISELEIQLTTNLIGSQDFTFNETFDRKLLQEFYGDSVEEAYLTFNMFLDTTAKEFLKVIAQIAIEDFKLIKKKLHKMQPNFKMIGLNLFYDKFSRLASQLNIPSLRGRLLESLEQLKDLFQSHYLPIIRHEIVRIADYLKVIEA